MAGKFNLSKHIEEVVRLEIEPTEISLLLSIWQRQGALVLTEQQRRQLVRTGALPSTVLRIYHRKRGEK